MRRLLLFCACIVVLALHAHAAFAAGGDYTVAGGSPYEQAQVRSALEASSFDWGLLPGRIDVQIRSFGDSYSTPGHVYLDATLLDSGIFSWAIVQHEFAHQVDFLLLDDAKRARLNLLLGGRNWCYGVAGLAHDQYGCERFASNLAWAYWPAAQNALRPSSPSDEAGSIAPAAFRALLSTLIGAPTALAAPSAKAYAPKPTPAKTGPRKPRR